MKSKQAKPDTIRALSGLKDFQRQTVDYVYRRLYEDEDRAKRFLVADEVGLGKTLVAKGIIAKAVENLWSRPDWRIDVIYICANADIARQNINRLNIAPEQDIAVATRMTLLPLHLHALQKKRLNFVSFTPGTSFNLRSQGGTKEERSLLYYLLRQAWGLDDVAGPKNLFQVQVGYHAWRAELANFKPCTVDDQLEQIFVQALRQDSDLKARFDDLVQRFSHHRRRSNIAWIDRQKQLAFIGDLRRLLARCCVEALEPDLIILDEFQRFKNLIDDPEDNEMALLAHSLFNYPDAKVLLLSATPYKMYTMYHEQADDDHYADFIRTIRFLYNSDAATDAFEVDLRRYREALLNADRVGQTDLQAAKEVIESKLRRVMVRTERLAITAQKDGMITESRADLGLLTAQDLRAFKTLDQIAQELDVRDMVEYWKSAPYLLNLMDHNGYKVKEQLVKALSGSDRGERVRSLLDADQTALLPWSDIQAYQPLDPGNAKLRTLLSHTVEKGAWQLLWIPPCQPYYQPGGPFAEQDLADFTKALVFSAWRVVPKVISTLCSYEAERRMVTALEANSDYQSERRRRRPLLRFALSEGRYTGMPNFTLLYPCLTLASELDPLKIGSRLIAQNRLPTSSQVRKEIAQTIEALLAPILSTYAGSKDGRADERWYWAALILLDRRYHRRPTAAWLMPTEPEKDWRGMIQGRGEDGTDTHFAEHIDILIERFTSRKKLGRPPDDLIQVLTKIALASPAVTSLRSLLRMVLPSERKASLAACLPAAAGIALGFRTLFNIADSITLIRSLYAAEDARYWESVLDYGISGNLQAVMDEYAHILREALGLMSQPGAKIVTALGQEIQTAVSIRTVNLNVDEISTESELRLQTRSLRCRFALRFGDDRREDEAGHRSEQVRAAFNSPFHPFVLATTSVGQEGLDFHQYCHRVVHWNLPANPVDLEQREGRVHRYKGHVIRRNVALTFPLASLSNKLSNLADLWQVLFAEAEEIRDAAHNDLVPYWIFEAPQRRAGYKVYRHIPALPLSRDEERLAGLRQTLVAYRMVFGQPRQEDLAHYLQSRMARDLNPDDLLQYRIDLSPASWWQSPDPPIEP